MHNIKTNDGRKIPRSGAELLRELGPFPVKLARFVYVMRGMTDEEIPSFTAEFARRHPKFARAMVNFVLDLAEMAPGTDPIWAECVEKMSPQHAEVVCNYEMRNEHSFLPAM